MQIWSLLYMAATPVLNIFIMASIGFLLTKKGIMDGRMRQGISQLLFWVLIPALTFSKLGKSLNFRDLGVWWILPVNMAYAIGTGLVVGYVAARVLRVEPWFRNILMCVIGIGNVGNLPIILVQGVCANENTIFQKDLPGDECEEKGIAYVAFAMWVASTFQFCVAINLMAKKNPELPIDIEAKGSIKVPSGIVELSYEPDNLHESKDEKVSRLEAYREGDEDLKRKYSELDESRGLSGRLDSAISIEELRLKTGKVKEQVKDEDNDETKDESRALLHRQASIDPEYEAAFAFATQAEKITQPQDKAWKKRQKEIERWMKGIPWGKYLNMPTIAAAAGISVGCVSILKNLLFGDTAPLGVVSQSISTMAGAMIPCMMLVLGSGLSEGPGKSALPLRVILGTILCRLFICPAIGYGSVILGRWIGIFHPPNSLFTLVLFICHNPPTALNLQTIAIINSNGEQEVATLICWQYLASLISVPMWMAIFLSTLS